MYALCTFMNIPTVGVMTCFAVYRMHEVFTEIRDGRCRLTRCQLLDLLNKAQSMCSSGGDTQSFSSIHQWLEWEHSQKLLIDSVTIDSVTANWGKSIPLSIGSHFIEYPSVNVLERTAFWQLNESRKEDGNWLGKYVRHLVCFHFYAYGYYIILLSICMLRRWRIKSHSGNVEMSNFVKC